MQVEKRAKSPLLFPPPFPIILLVKAYIVAILHEVHKQKRFYSEYEKSIFHPLEYSQESV